VKLEVKIKGSEKALDDPPPEFEEEYLSGWPHQSPKIGEIDDAQATSKCIFSKI